MKIFSFFRTIRFKIILLSALIISVVTICQTIYISNNIFSFSQKETEQTIIRDNNHVVKNIDNYLSSLETIAAKPSNEVGIMNILRKSPKALTEQEKNSNYYYIQMFLFRELMLSQENCESIFLYNESIDQYYGISKTYIIRDNNRYYDFSMIKENLENISYDESIFISGIQKSGMKVKPSSNYTITYALGIFENQKRLGAIIINLDSNIFYELTKDSKIEPYDLFYLIDQNNNIICSNDLSKVGSRWTIELPTVMSCSFTKEDQLFVASQFSEIANWRLITVSETGHVFKYEQDIKNSIITCAFLLAFFEIITISFVTTDLIKPITQISKNVSDIIGGNLKVHFVPVKGELGQLSIMLQTMLNTINNLIQQIYEKEERKRQLEINALQAQITPHFIYNTLSRIKWMAAMQEADGIVEALQSFSNILSYCIKNDNETIILKKELEFIKDYAELMNLKVLNEIEMVYDIDEKSEDSTILKFILQPIIENVFLHAFDGSEYYCTILVKCRVVEQSLIIEIGDNGKGIPPDRMEELLNKTGKDTSSIALKNISDRIKYHYGTNYGITIYSEINKGTNVVIHTPYIPYQREGG